MRFAGRAFTIRMMPVGLTKGVVGDYIDDVKPGHVVVLDNDGREDATVWGDILTWVASQKKAEKDEALARAASYKAQQEQIARATWEKLSQEVPGVGRLNALPASQPADPLAAQIWRAGQKIRLIILKIANAAFEKAREAAENEIARALGQGNACAQVGNRIHLQRQIALQDLFRVGDLARRRSAVAQHVKGPAKKRKTQDNKARHQAPPIPSISNTFRRQITPNPATIAQQAIR